MFSKFFNVELQDHFAEQENNLTPYFKDNPLIERMHADHRNIKAVFEDLKTKESDLKEGIAVLGKLLHDHIRFE